MLPVISNCFSKAFKLKLIDGSDTTLPTIVIGFPEIEADEAIRGFALLIETQGSNSLQVGFEEVKNDKVNVVIYSENGEDVIFTISNLGYNQLSLLQFKVNTASSQIRLRVAAVADRFIMLSEPAISEKPFIFSQIKRY